MKLKIRTFLVAASVTFVLLTMTLLSSMRRKRRSLKPLLNEEELLPPDGAELDLPEKYTTREYFAYVNVADIPYPPHPQNITDKWHSTGTTPEELIQLMQRFRVMMQVVRDKEGDVEPAHDYWEKYWRKRDRAKLFFHRSSNSLAWAYRTFYNQYHQVRVIKYRDQYEVESGMHRLWLAKQMGFEKLPVWVEEYFD